MEFKIQKEIFNESLAWIQGIVERKTTMPILLNVLIEAKGKSVHFTATDLEVGVTGAVAGEVSRAGKTTVPAKGLYEIVRQLPQKKIVHLNLLENHWVEIRCASSEFKLVGMDANEFPGFPKREEDGVEFDLDAKELMEMINKVDFAISTDESRFNLNGVLIETGEEGGSWSLKLVATDGNRLSVSSRKLKKELPLKEGVLFPRKGIVELKKLLEEKEGKVHFWVGKKYAVVESQERRLLVRLIDGKYPPYMHVIPKEQKRVLSVSKDGFTQALKRVLAVTTDQSKGVLFSISPNNLEVSVKNPDLGEAREEIPIQYKGPSFAVGFNASYFLECLNVLEDEQVVLQLDGEVSPCLIQSEFDRGFTHVIMPMRL